MKRVSKALKIAGKFINNNAKISKIEIVLRLNIFL